MQELPRSRFRLGLSPRRLRALRHDGRVAFESMRARKKCPGLGGAGGTPTQADGASFWFRREPKNGLRTLVTAHPCHRVPRLRSSRLRHHGPASTTGARRATVEANQLCRRSVVPSKALPNLHTPNVLRIVTAPRSLHVRASPRIDLSNLAVLDLLLVCRSGCHAATRSTRLAEGQPGPRVTCRLPATTVRHWHQTVAQIATRVPVNRRAAARQISPADATTTYDVRVEMLFGHSLLFCAMCLPDCWARSDARLGSTIGRFSRLLQAECHNAESPVSRLSSRKILFRREREVPQARSPSVLPARNGDRDSHFPRAVASRRITAEMAGTMLAASPSSFDGNSP